MTDERSAWTGIRRGLACRCPVCGQGALFGSYLKPLKACRSCGADNTIYPSDDLPPYLTILLAGHLLVPLYLLISSRYPLSDTVEILIWLPLATVVSLLLLPRMKGAAVGLCWANGLVRT